MLFAKIGMIIGLGLSTLTFCGGGGNLLNQKVNREWVQDSEMRVVCYDVGFGNTHNTTCFQLDKESFEIYKSR